LLDEIEKAHPDTFNILLQVLDEGRLTDNKGRVADFKNTIIIMTSNMGAHIIQERFENLDMSKRDEITDSTKEEVVELLKQTVRPEFLNRIDEIIMFTPLKMLAEKDIHFSYTDEAVDSLTEKGYDPQFGARPVKRVIQREILNQLSKEILAEKISSDSTILLDSFDRKFVFRNK
jgi:ATP-dependent Clp protease ATP-binding subunit ClpB